jgi:hypothetical protein
LKHWQTFVEFVEFDLNRKEREAAEDAAQVAKGQAILLGVFTAMWEPADWGMTAYQIGTDPSNIWSYAGLLPFVPAGTKSIFRAADKGADFGRAAKKGSMPTRIRRSGAGIARSTPASSAGAQAALRSKLKALRDAQARAVGVRQLPDGRIRYYDAERLASKPGATRGNAYVTEWDPATGQVRSWAESYDHAGNVIRVHPKMINGQQVTRPHYPPTGSEIAQ